MEYKIELEIEKLPEGYFLATSKDVQGLVVQARTLTETIEIAKDLARKLIEIDEDWDRLTTIEDKISYPLILDI